MKMKLRMVLDPPAPVSMEPAILIDTLKLLSEANLRCIKEYGIGSPAGRWLYHIEKRFEAELDNYMRGK